LPEIVNTEKGSQFTGTVFTDAVLSRGIALSMDGKEAGATTFLSNGCGAA
jgi:putative transposase